MADTPLTTLGATLAPARLDRRSLFRTAVCTLVTGTAVTAAKPSGAAAEPHPDAVLLADCRELTELQAQDAEVYREYGEHLHSYPIQIAAEARVEAYEEAMREILDRVVDAVPVTPEGKQARARVVLARISDMDLEDYLGTDGPAIMSVLRDAAGETGA